MTLLGDQRVREAPVYVSMIVINGMTLAVELYASRRMRREVVSVWTSRRTQAREQVRMRDELRYARELQLSMLPECAPKLDWADICSISLPATEVGGDYYDYFVDATNRRVALVCVDVAGHGMASGLVLAALRSGFTLLRESLHDPAAVLERLHTLVAETSRRRMLVTVSVVLIDRTNHHAIIASAGNPPVFVRRADASVETINLYAPPLGVRLPVLIPQHRIDLHTGDVIVLHSDGIYETRSPTDEVYGLDRIESVIRDHGAGSAETLRDALLADVAAFRGTREQDDDVTLVVCRLT
jgi:sigma-B regulation protein RsbU (phosphoserine phosphatase)